MNDLKAITYFAACTLPSMFAVPEAFDDNSHPAHDLLLEDLNSVGEEDLAKYISLGEVDHLINDFREKGTQYKLHYLIKKYDKRIDQLRKTLLLDNAKPEPYTHPELTNIPHDKNWLVSPADFSECQGGFRKGNEVFSLLPCTNATNSSYWLLQELLHPELIQKVKIRLDPLIH